MGLMTELKDQTYLYIPEERFEEGGVCVRTLSTVDAVCD